MKSMKKTIAALVAISMIFGCVIGGTLAWLVAQTPDVTNTFTASNIKIELKEHEYNPATNQVTTVETTSNENYKMVPGLDLPKDPWVKVESGSEKCWLFVEVTETANFDSYMTWAPDTSIWSVFEAEKTNANGTKTTILSCKIDTEEKFNAALNILNGQKVTVLNSVTKEMMEAVDGTPNTEVKPALTFKAYASQLNNNGAEFTAEQAWNNISNPTAQ